MLTLVNAHTRMSSVSATTVGMTRGAVTENTLVKIETPGSGRVPSASFYAGGGDDVERQCKVSVPYLEQLGARDEWCGAAETTGGCTG